MQVFDSTPVPTLKPVFTNIIKIWHKNGVAIEEISLLRISTNASGANSFQLIGSHYVYFNTSKSTYFYYKTLSDTAKFYKKYVGVDSFNLHGGWNFTNLKDPDYFGPITYLNDTIIQNVVYKRLRVNSIKEKNEYLSVAYFRCDKKNSIFKLDNTLSDNCGCPLVRIDDFPIKKGLVVSTELNFISDTLTKDESDLFEKWEKNETGSDFSK